MLIFPVSVVSDFALNVAEEAPNGSEKQKIWTIANEPLSEAVIGIVPTLNTGKE